METPPSAAQSPGRAARPREDAVEGPVEGRIQDSHRLPRSPSRLRRADSLRPEGTVPKAKCCLGHPALPKPLHNLLPWNRGPRVARSGANNSDQLLRQQL